jgi:hypothetical protein
MSTATETLSGHGVAIWLDDLSRARLETGTLAEMMIDQHVVGVTTNPSIFQAAITGSDDYVDDIARLAAEGANADAIVRRLTVDDVRRACELFTPVWQSTGGQDGRVSIEVDPRLARDTEATIIHGGTPRGPKRAGQNHRLRAAEERIRAAEARAEAGPERPTDASGNAAPHANGDVI